MATVLKIRIENEATASLQALEQQLQATAEVTAEQAVETRVLTDAQREQIQVIHEHRAAFSQMVANVGPGLIRLAEAGAAVGLSWWQARQNAVLLAKVYAELRERTSGLAGANQLLGAGASRALGVLTRTGPAIGLAVAAYKAAMFTLDQTGRKQKDLATDWSEATDEQVAAFNKVAAEANQLGLTVDDVLASMGKTMADFGAKDVRGFESNLDRLSEAGVLLGSNLAQPFWESAEAAKTLASNLQIDIGLFKAIDREVTRWSDQTIENLNGLGSGFTSLVDQMRAAQAEEWYGDGERYLEEINALRELEDLHTQLNEQREKERDHFARLRVANAQLDQIRTRSAEQERTRSLDTLAAIDGELDRQRQLAGQRASALEFDERAQQEFVQTIATLEQQRTAIVKRESEKQKELRKKVLEETETRERAALERRARDEGAAVRASVDRYNQWAEDVRAAHKRANDFAQQFANNANNALLKSLIERLDAEEGHEEEAHRARLELIQQEADQRMAAADTVEEREQAFYDGLMRMQQEQLQHQRETVRAEIEARKQAAEEAVAIERKKQEALKQTLQDAGIADGQRMLQQIDPRRALMDQRGKAAADEARKAVLNDPDNQQLRQQALVDVAASRRLRAMQERAAREAERSARAGAYRDLRRGDVDPAELAQAQANAGQQMLQTLRQNGQLSGDAVKILQENLQVAANQQGTLGELQRQLDQLQGPVKALLAGSAQQRQRATKGGLN